MRMICCCFLAVFASVGHAWDWQDLWLTPSQRAQRLMQQGQFAKAQKLFETPDWQATAAYRAQHYQTAAEQFSSLHNALGYYNQGNALAHLGRYKEAITAYDAALKINPANQDASFNRKLVEQLLQEEDSKQENQQSKDKNSQSDTPDQQDTSGQSNPSSQSQSKDGSSKDGKQSQANENPTNEGQSSNSKPDSQSDNPENPNDKGAEQPEQSKSENSQNPPQDQSQSPKSGKTNTAQSPEQSASQREKEQAKEQWLRLIPDEPGGLLREKFLRDHWRRQQGEKG